MFTKPEGRDEWKLLGLWILAGLGYSAFYLLTFRVTSLNRVSPVVHPILQWLVLRSFIPRASSWLKGTFAGYVLGVLGLGVFAAFIAVVLLLLHSQNDLLQSLSQAFKPTNGVYSIQQNIELDILAVVLSWLLAIGQADRLREYVRNPRWWIFATVIASVVGGVLGIAVQIVVTLGPSATTWLTVSWTLIYDVITGVVLVAMLRDRVPIVSTCGKTHGP